MRYTHRRTIYATWDEWAIVSNMVTALQSAVSGDAAYTTKQTALLTCMNGGAGGGSGPENATSTSPVGRSVSSSPTPTATPTPTYSSFDDILSRYTGDTKAKMDEGGACSTQAEAMFDTVESLSGSKLAALKTGSTEYAALLETPHGQQFEANVGADYIIKQFAYLLSYGSNPPNLPSSADILNNCLDEGIDGASLSLTGKLDVLNCLVFDTPHGFWVAQSFKTIDNNALKASGRFNWLGYGDWECTLWADGPLPSCLKHDVALSSLSEVCGRFTGNGRRQRAGRGLESKKQTSS